MHVMAKVKPIEKDNLYAVSDVTINNCITIRNIRIMQNKEGKMFIAMPQVKNKDNWKAIIELDNQAVRSDITKAILEEYAKTIQREIACDYDLCVKSISICDTDSLKAVLSLNLEGVTINNVKVLEDKKGELFVSMPQYRAKDKDGKEVWHDIVYPNNKSMRRVVEDRVLNSYHNEIQKNMKLPELEAVLKRMSILSDDHSGLTYDKLSEFIKLNLKIYDGDKTYGYVLEKTNAGADLTDTLKEFYADLMGKCMTYQTLIDKTDGLEKEKMIKTKDNIMNKYFTFAAAASSDINKNAKSRQKRQ